MKKHIQAGISLLIGGSLFLAGCSAQATPATPTIDPNIIYTQAAETVQAGIQAQPTVAPSQTPEPTATVAPTNTMDPTAAAGLTATVAAANQAVQPPAAGQTQTPGAPTPTLGTQLLIPTATTAPAAGVQPPATNPGDKCEWVSNSPKDNSKITKNSDFDAVIVIKNTGTTTWSTKYALRFFGGERMNIPGDYYLTREVKPGDMYTFQFVMKSPNSTGKKEALMAIQNDAGATMCFVNLPLEIVD